MSAFGDILRACEGTRIHFAGTEVATKWLGYMDGAIQAGEKAAHDICKKLSSEGVKLSEKKFTEDEEEDPMEEVLAKPFKQSVVELYLPNAKQLFRLLLAFAIVFVVIIFRKLKKAYN
ncbi:monoamine oxidase B-like protein [Reticulomyxa filosa]|uniref:monoamine oxidase n=1 Tax=Reticulomyxa filosa TaxID=46433 RepID=X6PES9_RETFI|nr:monoamine oxidase B-like protein [Reticulomyxa filosa]|eukprot:ETO36995.1 monoamine oxidase B-like protein [Reticulomyxa filosa]